LQVYHQTDIKLYPNPTNDYLSINSSNYLPTTLVLKIYNLNSKTYLESINYQNNELIDVSTFPPGIYVVSDEDGLFFGKFVKL